jgi:hypothetical protein
MLGMQKNTHTNYQLFSRWIGSLNPAINKSPWADDEIASLQKLVAEIGHKWGAITAIIGNGRSELSVRNQYYSRLRHLLSTQTLLLADRHAAVSCASFPCPPAGVIISEVDDKLNKRVRTSHVDTHTAMSFSLITEAAKVIAAREHHTLEDSVLCPGIQIGGVLGDSCSVSAPRMHRFPTPPNYRLLYQDTTDIAAKHAIVDSMLMYPDTCNEKIDSVTGTANLPHQFPTPALLRSLQTVQSSTAVQILVSSPLLQKHH